MTNSGQVFRAIHRTLNKVCHSSTSKRQNNALNLLTGFVCGIIQSKQVKLAHVAGEIPNQGAEESKVKSLQRWLKNKRVKAEVYYLPFINQLLKGLSSQPLTLAIDGSTTARGCMTLMISLIYKSRALPLVWVTRKAKKGHLPETMHVELLKTVKAVIAEGTEVVIVGDGEFDGIEWLSEIESYGWNFACRTAKNSVLYEAGERFVFKHISPEKGKMVEIAAVEFTDKRALEVRAVVYWGRKYEDPIYLVTNMPTGEEAFHYYRKRFRIETLFSDLKGRGFNLNKSGLIHPERVSRLLIAVSLAYIWLIYLGEQVKERGWLPLIHRAERCDFSLFQLGIRLLKRLLREGKRLTSFNFTIINNVLH